MILSKALSRAAQGSSYIKQALEGEHPKLLRLHLDLHKRLIKINASIFTSIKECGSQFENAYLSKSLARLLDAVHSMFASGVPTSEQVRNDKSDVNMGPSADKVTSDKVVYCVLESVYAG
jgi:hypothetical protein